MGRRTPATALAAALFAADTDAHGGMTSPLPRNSFGADLNPDRPGMWTNYYDDGCVAGCDECAHHGAMGSPGNDSFGVEYPWAWPSSAGCKVDGVTVPAGMNVTVPGADTLPDYARTWNIFNGKLNVGPRGDYGKFQPWRAPGASKIADPCGILCDHCTDSDDPARAKLFNGSALPPLQTPPVVWKAGGVAEAAWGLVVNHGGGYQWRLCKKDGRAPTEACFQAGALAFAENTTTIRYPDGSRPAFTIPSVDVTAGVVPEGSTWRRDPIPACACDSGATCDPDAGPARPTPGRGGGAWVAAFRAPYAGNDTSSGVDGCPYGIMFPAPWAEGYGYESERHVPAAGARPPSVSPKFNYEIVDKVVVPAEKGEYMLSWRWDTEQKNQVWGACADIVVE